MRAGTEGDPHPAGIGRRCLLAHLVRATCLVTTTALPVSLPSCPASADLIEFKDGSEMRGRIVTRTRDGVLVEFPFGTMTFSPEEIIAVRPEPEEPGQAAPAPMEAAEQEVAEQEAAEQKAATADAGPGEVVGEPDGEAPAGGEAPADEADAMTLASARKAAALIVVVRNDDSVVYGSGTVVNPKGAIVTNYHVVHDAKGIGVQLPGDKPAGRSTKDPRPYRGRLLKQDPCFDLALVRIPTKTPAYLRFPEDDAIQVGERVKAIGNPEGLTTTVSSGVVSALRKAEDLGIDDASDIEGCAHLSGRALRQYTLVQTDAAINSGNSGGPLLNSDLELVGINTLSLQYQGAGNVGLNFAVHIKHVRDFVGSYVKE